MATEYRLQLAAMPVCICGTPLREKGMVRRLTRGQSFRKGPQIGREKSSISRANIACYACGRDNIVEYLWIYKWAPERDHPPEIGYQLRPGDDPERVMAQLLEIRGKRGPQAARAQPRPVPVAPQVMTEDQADLARAWIKRIREGGA